MKFAPIILFIYNRPEHTKKTLEALSRNHEAKDSMLFIFADGPKKNCSNEQLIKVKKTRDIAHSQKWCKTVTIYESKKNLGLAKNIITGVTKIINKYGKAIILEDDLITSPYFLNYMNQALDIYENTDNVACIHAFMYAHKSKLPETFFIRGADCWGWATWKRAWDKFNPNAQELLDQIYKKKLAGKFNYEGAYNYTGMLQDQIDGKISSWAIRWLASAFLNDMYCLYPSTSLITNIGFDNSGTHCATNEYVASFSDKQIVKVEYQIPKQNKKGYNAIKTALCKGKKQSHLLLLLKKVLRKINIFRILKDCYMELVYHEAFNPKFLGLFVNPFYFARKGLYKNISAFSEIINHNGCKKKLLDVGCGTKPYKKLFNVLQYDGLEYAPAAKGRSKNANFLYDGHKFPFKNNQYDVIISNEVFEHLFNIEEILCEINRVLKKNGELLITVPFVWDEHEQPFDYGRYSSFGLKYLLEKNGFEIIKLHKSVNNLGVIYQLKNDYLYKKFIGKGSFKNHLFVNFLSSFNNIFGVIISNLMPNNDDLYLDNVVLAKKVRNVKYGNV